MQTISPHKQALADVNADAQATRHGLEALIVQIDALLPQTQCRQCGYEGCKPYATAIAAGEADINQCPPGGEPGLHALADLLQRPYQALNLAHGITKAKAVAIIDEATCIGCTLCINACPVDAILGASKYMHTVISQECTGCELCLPPCPVDCISMQTVEGRALAMNTAEADLARNRHQQRLSRQALEKHHKAQTYSKRSPAPGATTARTTAEPMTAEPMTAEQTTTDAIKKAAIAAAMARVKAQKADQT